MPCKGLYIYSVCSYALTNIPMYFQACVWMSPFDITNIERNWTVEQTLFLTHKKSLLKGYFTPKWKLLHHSSVFLFKPFQDFFETTAWTKLALIDFHCMDTKTLKHFLKQLHLCSTEERGFEWHEGYAEFKIVNQISYHFKKVLSSFYLVCIRQFVGVLSDTDTMSCITTDLKAAWPTNPTPLQSI